MPALKKIAMKKVFASLYQTPVEYPYGLSGPKTHAYFVRNCESTGQKSNLLLYSARYIEKYFDFLSLKGGVSRQFGTALI
jgi:hypothetical protein